MPALSFANLVPMGIGDPCGFGYSLSHYQIR